MPSTTFHVTEIDKHGFQKKKSPKGGVAVQMNDYLGKAAMYLKMYGLLKQCKLAVLVESRLIFYTTVI